MTRMAGKAPGVLMHSQEEECTALEVKKHAFPGAEHCQLDVMLGEMQGWCLMQGGHLRMASRV